MILEESLAGSPLVQIVWQRLPVALDTGYIIGVPDIIWEMCQVYWGKRGGKTSLEDNNSSNILYVTFLVHGQSAGRRPV